MQNLNNSATDPAEPSQKPAFVGTTFGPVGAYQKILTTASQPVSVVANPVYGTYTW